MEKFASHHVFSGHPVELKNIFDILNIVLIQASFISARIQQKHDVLLGNRLIFLMGIDTKQVPEDTVCGNGPAAI